MDDVINLDCDNVCKVVYIIKDKVPNARVDVSIYLDIIIHGKDYALAILDSFFPPSGGLDNSRSLDT